MPSEAPEYSPMAATHASMPSGTARSPTVPAIPRSGSAAGATRAPRPRSSRGTDSEPTRAKIWYTMTSTPATTGLRPSEVENVASHVTSM